MEFRPGRQEAPRGNTSSSCRSKRMGRGSKTNNNRQSSSSSRCQTVPFWRGMGWHLQRKGIFFFFNYFELIIWKGVLPQNLLKRCYLLFGISLWGETQLSTHSSCAVPRTGTAADHGSIHEFEFSHSPVIKNNSGYHFYKGIPYF